MIPSSQAATGTTVPLTEDGHSAGGSQHDGDGSQATAAGAEL